jgi:hypothetical protein
MPVYDFDNAKRIGSRVFVPLKPTIVGKHLSKGSLYLGVGATALDFACRPFDS